MDLLKNMPLFSLGHPLLPHANKQTPQTRTVKKKTSVFLHGPSNGSNTGGADHSFLCVMENTHFLGSAHKSLPVYRPALLNRCHILMQSSKETWSPFSL
jgi:hypothetical protein